MFSISFPWEFNIYYVQDNHHLNANSVFVLRSHSYVEYESSLCNNTFDIIRPKRCIH